MKLEIEFRWGFWQGSGTRFGHGQKALKFPVVCASTSNRDVNNAAAAALSVAIGKRGRSSSSIITTNAVYVNLSSKLLLALFMLLVYEVNNPKYVQEGSPSVRSMILRFFVEFRSLVSRFLSMECKCDAPYLFCWDLFIKGRCFGCRKKKAEGMQVLDGAAAAGDEHTEVIANGKPKVTTHLFEYEEGPWPCSVHIVPHLHDVAEALAEHIAHLSAESIKARGFFTIVLSGGSLVHVSLLFLQPIVSLQP